MPVTTARHRLERDDCSSRLYIRQREQEPPRSGRMSSDPYFVAPRQHYAEAGFPNRTIRHDGHGINDEKPMSEIEVPRLAQELDDFCDNLKMNLPPFHPSRCPHLNLDFLWKIFHQRQQQRRIVGNQNSQDLSRSEEYIQVLQAQGFPLGLATMVYQHSQQCPIRIWLVGNSGTMHQSDGHMVSQSCKGKIEVVDCSRWQEVTATVQWHAELAAWCQTPMVVRFLQDPGALCPQQLGVCASQHYSSNEEVKRLQSVLQKMQPTGASTPLQSHLEEIVPYLKAFLPKLQQSTSSNSSSLVLCICTDSIPTDVDGNEDPDLLQEFLSTLQQLSSWRRVQLIIRLSTEEERVVRFYKQQILSDVMMRVQVLDDYVSECQQVQKYNPWLFYGHPLHLCREEGIYSPVLETLSQRPLTAEELVEAVGVIFGQVVSTKQVSTFSHEQQQQQEEELHPTLQRFSFPTNYSTFRNQVERWNKEASVLWNPIKKAFVPWVDLKKLDRCYKRSLSNHDASLTSSSSHTHASSSGDKCTIM